MSDDPMTPSQFLEAMRKIRDESCGDQEFFHTRTDGLMEELLTSLGYGDGIKILEDVERWYA